LAEVDPWMIGDSPAMTELADQQYSLRPILVSAFGPALMFGVAEGAVLPVVALTARDLGASVATASVVVALIGVGSLISNVPSAYITTRYGERAAIIGAGAISAVAMLVALAAPNVAVLGLAMLMIGLANAVFLLARQTYLTESVPLHLRARALSTLGGTARIGLFIGPFVGALVISLSGIRAAYLVACAAAVIAGLIAVFSTNLVATHPAPGDAPKTTSIRTVLRSHRRVFLTVGIGILLISAVRSSRQVVIPLWAEHLQLSPSATSLIYGLSGAVDMLVFYPAGKLMDQRGRQWVVLPSMLLMGLSLILLPLSSSFLTLLVPALTLGFGNGIGAGMVATMGADLAPPGARPSFLGIWRLLSDAGNCGGPVLLSAITGLASLAAGIVTNGGIGFVAAVIVWFWLPRSEAGRPAPRIGGLVEASGVSAPAD
jgi:MFS family permease